MNGNIVAFIPVRGGSTSIPLKNIKLICGRPLVYWTAAAAAASNHISKVFVSTDSDEIRQVVEALHLPKVVVIDRSPETATNTASSESALLEFAQSYEFENVMFIQATSPLLTAAQIDEAISIFLESECDSVLSVVRDKRFYWKVSEGGYAHELNYDVFNRPRRQDFEGCLMENGAFYLTSRSALMQSRNRVSGKIRLYEMPEASAFEIDEPGDWDIIEGLLKRQLARLISNTGIRLFLTDCDGCLTDGGMYYTEHGDEAKKFNARDGMAFSRLRRAGIETGIITSESVSLNRRRAEKIGVTYFEDGCKDKLAAVSALVDRIGLRMDEVCYIGDDLNDVDLLGAVGFSCCPADAVSEVKRVAQYVASARGGEGVIREIADYILSSRENLNV